MAAALSKAEFIRQFPVTTPPRDIVKAAKAKGLKMTPAYVYNVRHGERQKQSVNRARGSSPLEAPVPEATPIRSKAASGEKIEEAFFAAAEEIGLGRALSLLVGRRDANFTRLKQQA